MAAKIAVLFIILWSIPGIAEDSVKGVEGVVKDLEGLNTSCRQCSINLDSKQKCSEMVETFCKELYAKPRDGNMDLPTGQGTLQVRLGPSENGFTQRFVDYAQAKLKAREKMPVDLQKHLDESNYFPLLQKYLANKKVDKLTQRDQLAFVKQGSEVAAAWNDAFKLTLIDRMEKNYPDYNKMDSIPPKVSFEAGEETKKLDAQINRAIWENSQGWENTKKLFENIRHEFLAYLKENTSLPEKTKQKWLEKIQTLELVLPHNPSKDLSDCSSAQVNAFYDPEKHQFTVCAGMFNSLPEFSSTIAHEMAHALDPGNETEQLKNKSPLAQSFFQLETDICVNAPLKSCPKLWNDFSSTPTLAANLASIADWNPPENLDKFYQCLQYDPPKEKPTEDYIKKSAKDYVRQLNSIYADNNIFLSLTKKEDFDAQGRKIPNPNYLNPCGLEKPDANKVDLARVQGDLFTAAYICADPKLTDSDKIRWAGKKAADIQKQILEKIIPIGVPYSNDSAMIVGGFSENVGDVLGQV
ncbi:MAG: hypothetical protein WCG27_09015 [Pseudomonadota bacterium]